MGECGCDIEVRRCSAHAGDVILVLEPEEAEALLALHVFDSINWPEEDLPLPLLSVKRKLERGGLS